MHQLKSSGNSDRTPARGQIVEVKTHDSNGYIMVRLKFEQEADQRLFGDTFFYLDDLEAADRERPEF